MEVAMSNFLLTEDVLNYGKGQGWRLCYRQHECIVRPFVKKTVTVVLFKAFVRYGFNGHTKESKTSVIEQQNNHFFLDHFSELVVMCEWQEYLQPAQILHRSPPQASVATRDDTVQCNWKELEALFSCCIVDFSYSCWQAPTTVEDKT